MIGLKDSFFVNVDDVVPNGCSDTSSPEYPPGLEPPIEDMSDDDSSSTCLDNNSYPVIPLKLRNELKRLGIYVEVITSPPSRKRSSVTSRGKYYSK